MSNADPFHDLVPGYPKLAGRMGVMPEITMFWRFGALNACNLLYMQNDLYDLEEQLKKAEADDAKSKEGEKRFYAQDCFWTEADAGDGVEDTKHHDLVVKMRGLLKQYSKW